MANKKLIEELEGLTHHSESFIADVANRALEEIEYLDNWKDFKPGDMKYEMNLFGSLECPNCGSTWTGSIGWDTSVLSDKDRLNRLLQTGCGCEPVDDPVYPEGSASCIDFVASEKRKQIVAKQRENKDVDGA